MKPNRDANSIFASLTNAAAAPLPLPDKTLVAAVLPQSSSRNQASKTKTSAKTVAISLRPGAALLNRYTNAAADRTKREGRVISAQQIMLEVLEAGLKVQK